MDLNPQFGIMPKMQEGDMPDTIVTLGDFSATVEPNPSENKGFIQWAARWNSGVNAQVINPFRVEEYVTFAEEPSATKEPVLP